MSRSIRVSALLVLCLGLIAFPAFAGQGSEKTSTYSASVVLPTSKTVTERDLPSKTLDLSKMPVILDGVPLPEGPQAKRALSQFYLAIDGEREVINAFRNREELEAHIKASGALDCNSQNKVNETCVFWNAPGCTGTRAVFVACRNAVGNITGPNGLNGPIRSFNLGCGTTFLFPNSTCTGTGDGFTGPAGTCINTPFPNSLNCAGCTM